MILKETASGTIELVSTNVGLLLQFNCTCVDALPYCNAMCCRMRPVYNAKLEDNELEKFKFVQIQDLNIVPPKAGTSDCVYLNDAKCEVHSYKPQACKEWHCSPKGNLENKEIKRRDIGWLLMPIGMVK